MSEWINFNGSLKKTGTAIITAASRAFRYGDGLFETMRITDAGIDLKDLHFQRLSSGMKTLQISLGRNGRPEVLEEEVWRTVDKNGIRGDARVRLAVFRGEGGLYDTEGGAGFVIEAWPLERRALNENGLDIGIYDQAMKSCDRLANIKSNNYLVYVMAALHARAQRWNDCLVLNSHGRVCDATIANLFWIKDKKIFTPPLTEGCVAGVMRRHLLQALPAGGFTVKEHLATTSTLETADEIFLTNAISGIRWVKSFNAKNYNHSIVQEIFRKTF